jgi:hypothetical protein
LFSIKEDNIVFLVKKHKTMCTEPMDGDLCVLLLGLAASYLTLFLFLYIGADKIWFIALPPEEQISPWVLCSST